MGEKKQESRIYDDLIQNCEELLKQNTAKYQSYLELQELLRLQFIGTNHDFKRLKTWLDTAYKDFLAMKHSDFTQLYEVLVKHNIVKQFVDFGKKQETLQLQFIEIINECVNLKEDLNSANKSVISLKREYNDLIGSNDAFLETTLAKESFSFARSLEILRMNFIEIIENNENSQILLDSACNGMTKIRLEHNNLKQQYEALSENKIVKEFTDYAKYQESLQLEVAKQANDPKSILDRVNQNLASLKLQLTETSEMLNVEQQRCQRIESERDSLDKLSEELCHLLLKYQRRNLPEDLNDECSSNNETLDDHRPSMANKEDSDVSANTPITVPINESVQLSNTFLNNIYSKTKNCDVMNCSFDMVVEQDSPLQLQISNVTNQRKTPENLKKSVAFPLKTSEKCRRKISNSSSDICDRTISRPGSNVLSEEELYKCPVCCESFSAWDLLDSHAVVHNLTTPFKGWKCNQGSKSESAKNLLEQYVRAKTAACFCCAHCERRFSYKNKLANHIKRRHLPELCKRFECTVCGQLFAIERQLEYHKSIKHQHQEPVSLHCNMSKGINVVHEHQKSYNSTESSETFTQKSNFQEHKLAHISQTLFKCSFCSKSFKNRSTKKIHERTRHKEYMLFYCAHCDKQSYSKKNISIHLQKCHSPNSKKSVFECSHCNTSVLTEVHSVEQESVCCSKTENKKKIRSAVVVLKKFAVSNLTCGICDRLFSCTDSLNKHKRIEHNKLRPYKCGIRGKSFPLPSRVRDHQSVHTSNRPFKCSHCNKTYKESSSLSEHVHLVHEQTPFWICAHCNRSFSRKQVLKRHIITQHLNGSFVCSKCRKSFQSAVDLEKHENMHSLGKPFKCLHCDKSYSYSCNRKAHMEAVHQQQVRFICAHCNKSFYRKSHFVYHLNTNHFSESLHQFKCTVCNKSFALPWILKQHCRDVHSKKRS